MASNSSNKGTELEEEQEHTSGLEQPTETPSAGTSSDEGTADGTAGDHGRQKTPDKAGASAEKSATGASAGIPVAGAAAVTSAGLGLSSLTGTSFSEMMRTREEIVGQIEASTGGGGDPIAALYGTPWDAAAMINGIFALVAIVLGGVLLAVVAKRPASARWVGAVALGGVVLGVIGLVVAGGMYLDLFAGAPVMPPMPSMPGGGG